MNLSKNAEINNLPSSKNSLIIKDVYLYPIKNNDFSQLGESRIDFYHP